MIEVDSSSDSLSEIELLLRSKMGLDSSTVGSSMILRAVEHRQRDCGIASIGSYARRVSGDPEELRELIELVVVPETYFFREPDAISDVVKLVMAHRPMPTSDAPLRVLSVPCSSGEEPYSIVMALQLAGLPLSAISVDAMDISRAAVARTQRGEFRRGSFRGEVGEWGKFFTEMKHLRVIDRNVRDSVRARQGNIVDPGFEAPRNAYDVIFCRNLLIYFDTETQSRALATLARHLAHDGVLVVGSADSFAVRRAGFEPLPGSERSFLFRLASNVHALKPAAVKPTVRTPLRRTHVDASRAAPPRPAISGMPGSTRRSPGESEHTAVVSPALLHEMGKLADEGRLALALELGEHAVRQGCVSSELLALMGTTYAAVLDLAGAERCYRRALFLDPHNEDALLHLSLLLEKRGDSALAARLRARARATLGSRAMVEK